MGKHGDIEKGFEQADYVCEDYFESPRQVFCFLESGGVVAQFDLNGNLPVWTWPGKM